MNGQIANVGNLSPQDGFLVTSADYLSAYSEELLTYLYQPLTGAVGFSLYHLFESLIKDGQKALILSDRQPHNWLITMLGEDLSTFFNARSKLEALGLLQSYRKTDQIGTYFVYELHAPLNPEAFFAEPLLSVFLRDQVGSSRFVQIQHHFKKQHFDATGYTNVSQDFTTVFAAEVDRTLASGASSAPRPTAQASTAPRYTQRQLRTFDWDWLIQSLADFQINRAQVEKNMDLIFTLHQFYNIDEVPMAELIEQSMNRLTNAIEPKRLQSMAQQRFDRAPIPVDQPTSQKISPIGDQELIKQAQRLDPATFLRWHHARMETTPGQFDYTNLRKFIQAQDLAQRVLSVPVINVLVHYVLSTNDNILKTAKMDALRNQWLGENIATAQQAVQRIHDWENKPQTSRYRPRTVPHKTKQPAWADPNYQAPAAKEADAATKKRLAEQLAKFQNDQQDKQKGGRS
ncbi:MAG: hypothetical protein LKI92_04380 [Schleiferilactobacillus harbinensis]|jgi:replication initiation and membrane attachment protein|nr:hypothetical protein [Schleiferilactobacillus harbinensis]MCI1912308.1 hypothetical protein [Schleiferilactobacillus harbinensis]